MRTGGHRDARQFPATGGTAMLKAIAAIGWSVLPLGIMLWGYTLTVA